MIWILQETKRLNAKLMLYYLFQLFKWNDVPGSSVFQYINISSSKLLLSFSLLISKWFWKRNIEYIKVSRVGETIISWF